MAAAGGRFSMRRDHCRVLFYQITGCGYYGNMYSKNMLLGQYPPKYARKMRAEVKKWEAADPATPVKPALICLSTAAMHGKMDSTVSGCLQTN